MRKLLIVSPHFPPVNGADMHRVRLSLPHFAEFGWQPRVLAVEPSHVEIDQDPLLLETVPKDVSVRHVSALSLGWTRKLGVGAIGLRAWPYLRRAGSEMIRESRPDLIYFSTTAFPVMTLGRVWKKQFGVPFVLDLQDPWASDYEAGAAQPGRSFKSRMARGIHRRLEPWTMRAVDGLIAVSDDYIKTLRRRYPWLAEKPARTLPFGGSPGDFDLVQTKRQVNRFFQPGPDELHGVYVGRAGNDMTHALRIILGALSLGLKEQPEVFSRLRLHFIGTDYAPAGRARKTVEPIAAGMQLEKQVNEHTGRVPYFEALQLLRDADFLMVPGSGDPQYTASKIYPYVLAKKPLLAVFHQASSVVQVLETTRAGCVVTFATESSADDGSRTLLPEWSQLLRALPFTPDTDWQAFQPYTAREMTRRQCELFDWVVNHGTPLETEN